MGPLLFVGADIQKQKKNKTTKKQTSKNKTCNKGLWWFTILHANIYCKPEKRALLLGRVKELIQKILARGF